MTILVTGGAGYIGSHAVLALIDAGFSVVVADNLTTGRRQAVPVEIPLVKVDLGDESGMSGLFETYKPSAVMHFAGSIVVPESVERPLDYYSNNVGNTLSLLKLCQHHGVKNFIFSSTAAVYGEPEVIPVTEENFTNPINPYGWSKLMSEQMIKDASVAHGLNYGILRYFNVAGADPEGRVGQSTPGATHLIKIASQVALGLREKISVFGTDYLTRDGTCVRDYIHVSDLVYAHVLVLKHLQNGKENFIANCGYGHGYSVREVLDETGQVIGRDIPTEDRPRRAGDPPNLVADVTRIHDILDWNPKYDDLGLIIKTALNWERTLQGN
ncbi:MAG: UDP-glucose 4-epimerase GalE [Halopseudomonas aestusnigri]